MTPQLIDSSEKMDALLEQLNDENLIAVDTEFQRETTYYPHLALVQVATDSIVACIDPLAFDAKPALQKILLDEDTTKIFHSCSQDMEVLFYYLDETPGNIYDTQIANALLSEHHQIGYAALVENELGMLLDKSQTRTNWLQRPLTKKQIQYAGDDVLYLYQLHAILDEKLQQLDRKNWFEEDSSKLIDKENNYQVALDKLWKRVKGASRLNRNRLMFVQCISLWRENLAQQKDKTRRKILTDDILIDLALNPPDNSISLDKIIGPRYSFNTDEKNALLEAIDIAAQSTEQQWPDNRFNSLDGAQKNLLKDLQQMVNKKAEQLEIAPAIICSRKNLEELILQQGNKTALHESSLNVVHGWRLQCIGRQLLEALGG